MQRKTTIAVSDLLHERGTPFLKWSDVPTSTLSGYKLDIALLALWENVLGRQIAAHVKLGFHPSGSEVWADIGLGLKRWNPTNDSATAQHIADACGLSSCTPEDLRAAVEKFVGSDISVPELRFK